MDFTVKKFRELIEAFIERDYAFIPFIDYLSDSEIGRFIILRHDVDRLPERSLAFARIEAEYGIKGTYYFRTVPGSWDENVIKEISLLGHEIGYHYEDMAIAAGRVENSKRKGEIQSEYERRLAKIAIEMFKENLRKINKIARANTACMHGSPLSRYDSRDLWNYYDYRELGLFGEPYFDLDTENIAYLTDTGRRWDGGKVSVRDKFREAGKPGSDKKNRNSYPENVTKSDIHGEVIESPKRLFHSTDDIINSVNSSGFPEKAMITLHPQRWTDTLPGWLQELILQNIKNQVKFIIVRDQERRIRT